MKDRGHKKWTALMLPEHKNELRRWAEAQHDMELPAMEADLLEQLDQVLATSQHTLCQVKVSYIENKRLHHITGTIRRCEPLTRSLLMDTDSGSLRISLLIIVSITRL